MRGPLRAVPAIALALAAAPAAAAARAAEPGMRLAYLLHYLRRERGGIRYEDMLRRATVFLPSGYRFVAVNDGLSQFAMRDESAPFELRFRFDSEAALERTAARAGAAPPDRPSPELAAVMLEHLAGADEPPSLGGFAPFPPAAVKKEFGADWGFILLRRFPIAARAPARGFTYGQVYVLHKNGVGTYTIFQLYGTDSFAEYKRLALGAFHVLKFESR
ncbi:MAG: hypothetical protein KGM24_02130 [Elusimicrobia bacterium]|nr:hypothetical protein [Elusimicrobiota bacterium]